MKNKLTVLGLVAATAFIFTSCTKDTDVSPGSKFAAPTATLEAPTLNDGAIAKSGNEYEEADNGYSIPGMETATPNEPTQSPPTINNIDRIGYWSGVKQVQSPSEVPTEAGVQANTTRYQEYYTGIKDEPTPNQIPPVMDSPSADRYEGTVKNLYPESPLPNEPNVVPHTSMNPVHSSSDFGKFYVSDDLPDCTFPVVNTQITSDNDN